MTPITRVSDGLWPPNMTSGEKMAVTCRMQYHKITIGIHYSICSNAFYITYIQTIITYIRVRADLHTREFCLNFSRKGNNMVFHVGFDWFSNRTSDHQMLLFYKVTSDLTRSSVWNSVTRNNTSKSTRNPLFRLIFKRNSFVWRSDLTRTYFDVLEYVGVLNLTRARLQTFEKK